MRSVGLASTAPAATAPAATVPPNKHPSFGRKPVPTMQLLAQLSKFDGRRKESIADTLKLEEVAQSGLYEDIMAKEKLPAKAASARTDELSSQVRMTTMLDPNYKNPVTTEVPSTIKHHYTYNAHMNSAVGKMLHNSNEAPVAEAYVPSRRLAGPVVSNFNNALIGGQGAGEDAWKTTTQMSSNGEALDPKKHQGKKLARTFEPELFVSPITGEQIANYGTWAEDTQRKKAGVAQPASAQDDLRALEKSDPVMFKLKTQLALRGAKGVIGLSRVFRIMDDDRSNSLSFAEFKKAMQDFGMALNDTELVVLFKRFDVSKTGAVSYNQFLRTIAGSLSERRRKLVNTAFDVLDKDGSGQIELADIAMAYDASRHPDVVTGKRTAEQVLVEFLDGFDVGGDKDGRVTRQEFENYYSTMSASIDSDDYFELMIRNAWHISGGEGAAANTANLRVLVTLLDGSQRVEEVKNDLGLKAGDAKGVMARLKAQGVPVASVSFFDGGGSEEKASLATARRPGTASSRARPGTSSGGAPGTRRAKEGVTHRSSEPSAGLKLLIDKIKTEMRSRGAGGYVGLQRRFRIMDDDGSKTLDLSEFKKAMKELRMGLGDNDLRALFEHFDADGGGTIDFDEFVQGVREPLNARRLKLVHQAFALLDKDGSGEVNAQEIASMYDASQHPEVKAKRKTPAQVLREFLDTFDVGGVKDGMVTRSEFENYYANLGASIDKDDYFELMIRNAWHMTNNTTGGISSSANLAVLVTDGAGVERRVVLDNDLGVQPGDLAQIYARLRSQGVSDVAAINGKVIKVININGVDVVTAGGGTTSQLRNPTGGVAGSQPAVQRAAPAARPQSAAAAAILARQQERSQLGTSASAAQRPIAGPADRSAPGSSASLRTTSAQLAGGVLQGLQRDQQAQAAKVESSIVGSTLLSVLRVQLLAKGPAGIIDLQRKFVEMDVDNSKALDQREFTAALAKAGMAFSQEQVDQLFRFLDRDASGLVDYPELLQGLRGPMNPTLLVLAHQAFDRLDPAGRNLVDPQDLLMTFDAARHPDVATGARSAEDVLQDLLDTFDVGAVTAGKITREEFVDYYSNLAAATGDDDYMELVLRRTWHLGDDVALRKMLQQKEREQEREREGSRTMGRIKDAQDWARPGTAGGVGGVAGVGLGGLQSAPSSRPQSANRTIRGGGRYPVASPAGSSADPVEEKYKAIQRQAILSFNQSRFEEAATLFEDALRLLQAVYPSNHPECVKAEKSVLLAKRKLEQQRSGRS